MKNALMSGFLSQDSANKIVKHIEESELRLYCKDETVAIETFEKIKRKQASAAADAMFGFMTGNPAMRKVGKLVDER